MQNCYRFIRLSPFYQIVIFLLCSFLASYAYAAPVTQQRAQDAAQEFLLKEQSSPPQVATKEPGKFIVSNQAAGLALAEILSITDETGEILAYVQELEPQGFIIISGDDAIRRILGFSFDSKFFIHDNQANPLLDLVKADVYARKSSSAVSIHESIEFGSATEWGPWLQSTWQQGPNWNQRCPYEDPINSADRRPVGCVATAMAQIINYWQYPSSVRFSNEDYFYISRAVHSFNDAHTWGFPSLSEINDNMSSLQYNGDWHEEAYLSFAAGAKLHMNYGVSQSAANTFSVGNVLRREFEFGSAIPHSNHSGVWFEHSSEVIEDMKSARPVQIGIHKTGERGGHSIVVDGYRDNDDWFHLNYGWGANSPDPISTAWYNLPTNMPHYDVIHTVVYGIAKYQGWNQIGADQRNSYCAIYPAPIGQPDRKWCVSEPTDLPITNTFSHMVVGAGGRIYASLGPVIGGDIYHPHIAIYDKFGTQENVIEVTHSNVDIPNMCQNSRGEIFFSSGTGGPTTTDSRVYRLNPKNDEITLIFTHNSPDAGGFDVPFKVDRDDYLYFVIHPVFVSNFGKFYSISRTGTNQWTPYSFPSAAEFHRTQPAIDEDRDRVYLNYFEKTEQFKGRSRLIAFKKSDGTVVFDNILPNIPTHFSSGMAGAPSIGEDGTVFIGAYTSLYAYSSAGTKLWEQSFFPGFTYQTPAIDIGGQTLYVNYGKMINNVWHPGFVRALNVTNGSTKWEMPLGLGESDFMGEIYCAANGMVIYSYNKNGQDRWGGLKDNGTSYESRWDMAGGGTIAFGPGRTIYSLQHNSICAWTDLGDRGDPEGKGMDFTDNAQPSINFSPVSPTDGTNDHDTASIQLSWTASDPNGHPLKYDIYVGALVDSNEVAFAPVASQVMGNSYTLTDLMKGTQYLWSVVATDGQAISEGPTWSFSTKSGTAVEEIEEEGLPASFHLAQNYPNPFNPITRIEFSLPRGSYVKIDIYNVLGQHVRNLVNERLSVGNKAVTWNGTDDVGKQVTSGVYIYRIIADEFVQSKKMLLLK